MDIVPCQYVLRDKKAWYNSQKLETKHCVKSIYIWSFSDPYSFAFGPEKFGIRTAFMRWNLCHRAENYSGSITTTNKKSLLLEQDTVGVTEKKECVERCFCRKKVIESWKVDRMILGHSSFEFLANEISSSKEELFHSIKGNIKYEKTYRKLTRERFHGIANFYLYRNFEISNWNC